MTSEMVRYNIIHKNVFNPAAVPKDDHHQLTGGAGSGAAPNSTQQGFRGSVDSLFLCLYLGELIQFGQHIVSYVFILPGID